MFAKFTDVEPSTTVGGGGGGFFSEDGSSTLGGGGGGCLFSGDGLVSFVKPMS